MRRRVARSLVALACVPVAAVSTGVSPGAAADAGPSRAAQAVPDTFRVRSGQTLQVGGAGVFDNDRGDLTTVVSHTRPEHGALTLNADGSLRYTPEAGFTGTDTFRYSSTDAVDLYRTDLPPLATIGGVPITGGAYGSSFTAVPGSSTEFYGLTDRGPNVDGPNATKVEAIPDFIPAIGRFRLVNGKARLERTIRLQAPDNTPFNGQVNCAASTGETITDLAGTKLPCTDTGYDPEGLVALKDGTFWVSDEYGPLLTHFDSTGRQLGRLSPFDRSLPRELANRVANRGMEGLTVTPDGRTLVGIMQSALQQPDLTKNPKNVAPLRIVTVDLTTFRTHEYLYLLDDPETTGTAASEITAVSNTEFVVDERDGKVEPNAYKRLYTVDISGATDVGPAARVPGATYAATRGGLLLGTSQQSIEGLVGKDATATARGKLVAAGVTPATKKLTLDLGAFVTRLDPTGGFFGHDKIEGVAALDAGRTLVISNDNDFGIDGLTTTTPPFALHAKVLPDGRQDDGEYLSVDTTRLDHPVTSTTVSILVTGA